MTDALQDVLWAGDTDRLHELAPCACCCAEHTGEGCDARAWGGCRGQHTATRADLQGWADHYKMALGDFLDPPPATD